jgi:hypothetical protein
VVQITSLKRTEAMISKPRSRQPAVFLIVLSRKSGQINPAAVQPWDKKELF